MKILFIIPYVPNLIRTRSFNLLKHLSARGNQISLLTICASDEDRREAIKLQAFCEDIHCYDLPRSRSYWNCVLALPTRQPLQAVYSWKKDLAERAIASLPEFDVVHVEHLRGALYGISLLQYDTSDRPPIVWDSVDCISHLFQQASEKSNNKLSRIVTRLELPRTRRYEAWLAQQFDQVLITSKKDKEELCQLVSEFGDSTLSRQRRTLSTIGERAGKTLDIAIIPNGVDVEYFTPDSQPRDSQTIVFSGKMSYHANIAAASFLSEEVMPIVWSKDPSVRLVIVGKDPPNRLRKYAHENPDRVQVTGTVPDIRRYLRAATVAAVPILYGAGSQFKVLEAMACGTPVVATSLAISSFELRPDKDLIVADRPDDFASALLQLISDKQQQDFLSKNGRQIIEQSFGWNCIAERLESIYDELIHSR